MGKSLPVGLLLTLCGVCFALCPIQDESTVPVLILSLLAIIFAFILWILVYPALQLFLNTVSSRDRAEVDLESIDLEDLNVTLSSMDHLTEKDIAFILHKWGPAKRENVNIYLSYFQKNL